MLADWTTVAFIDAVLLSVVGFETKRHSKYPITMRTSGIKVANKPVWNMNIRNNCKLLIKKSLSWDSNPRPIHYEWIALPTELKRPKHLGFGYLVIPNSKLHTNIHLFRLLKWYIRQKCIFIFFYFSNSKSYFCINSINQPTDWHN